MDAGEFYDDMWQRYGHLDSASPAAFHRRRLILELCTRHAAGARQVLDAGCGQGELVQELRLGFPTATLCASDVSLASVRETKRLNPNLEVLQMDLTMPDFERIYQQYLGRFELITCSEVVEHIPDDCLAVERVARLLAPRGTLVLTVPGGKMSSRPPTRTESVGGRDPARARARRGPHYGISFVRRRGLNWVSTGSSLGLSPKTATTMIS